MRKGWRWWVFGLVILLSLGGDLPRAGAVDGERTVRLTVEIAWSTPTTKMPAADENAAGVNPGVELEVSAGHIVDVIAGPDASPAAITPTRRPDGVWVVGAGPAGRVRARVEAPIGARIGLKTSGAVPTSWFPVAAIIEGAQRSAPQPKPAVEYRIERLPWDALHVSLAVGDGVVAPGTQVPAQVAFNVLTPEPTEVNLLCTAELRPSRGGEALWRQEVRQVVATDDPDPKPTPFPVPMPEAEGTYVLEVRASWEPRDLNDANTLLGRMFRRGKRNLIGGMAPVVRRVSFAVLAGAGAEDPKPLAARFANELGVEADQEVDAIDLTRLRGHRPSASGRTPWASAPAKVWAIPDEAHAEPTRRDRLRGWISRLGPEVAHLAPADANGLAWSALGLKVTHPGRPHRLTVLLVAGNPSSFGVAVVGQGGMASAPARPRLLLDACASGPPILPDGPPATFSWLVWPDSPDPVLVLVNRAEAEGTGVGAGMGVRVGSVTLTELAALPEGPAVEGPTGSSGLARGLGVALSGADALDRFGGDAGTGAGPSDAMGGARNLAHYLAYCGATTVVLPADLADRAHRQALEGQAAEDAIGPDRLELTLKVLARQGLSAWLDLPMSGTLPGLPPPASAEALAKGLVRVDRKGLADGASYHPLNPEVRAAIKRHVVESVTRNQNHGKLAGVLVRLGQGPTLLGAPDTGLDDATFARFAREAFDPDTVRGVPGLDGGHDDPDRFAARSRFLAGSGRMPWLTWRAEQVAAFYKDLAETTRQAAPGLTLAVATPELVDGPAGSEARRADLAGLDPSLAWRALGLDLDVWPTGENAPAVFRGVTLGPDVLAHDLAISPELDARVAARPTRGLLLDANRPSPPLPSSSRGASPVYLTAQPVDAGPLGDEPLGHALAALDPRWVVLAASSVAGREDRTRRFTQVFRALPAAASPMERPTLAFGVAVRSAQSGDKTYLSLANDTPYPIRVDTVLTGAASARVYDLGRAAGLKPESDAAGRHLVLDLLPFGAAGVRVDAAGLKVASVKPYPTETVLSTLQARYDEITTQLSRLSRGSDPTKDGEAPKTSPPNPGFEPGPARVIRLSGNTPPEAEAPTPVAPGGWRVAGGTGAGLVIDPDFPHAGQGSLRLDAPSPPAATLSDDFAPDVHSVLVLRAWVRSDRADAKVRLWVEGESSGKAYRRVSETTANIGWTERVVRLSDVPPVGLDSARVRVELLTPGSLWVDDLSVSGETLSEPERRNARNALLAAMQAYKDKRYADFARLATSHWTRHPGMTGPGNPELTRTGDASALPPGRRLR